MVACAVRFVGPGHEPLFVTSRPGNALDESLRRWTCVGCKARRTMAAQCSGARPICKPAATGRHSRWRRISTCGCAFGNWVNAWVTPSSVTRPEWKRIASVLVGAWTRSRWRRWQSNARGEEVRASTTTISSMRIRPAGPYAEMIDWNGPDFSTSWPPACDRTIPAHPPLLLEGFSPAPVAGEKPRPLRPGIDVETAHAIPSLVRRATGAVSPRHPGNLGPVARRKSGTSTTTSSTNTWHWPETEPLEILDVGCAQGTLALLLAERGHRVTAVDLRADFLQYAQSRHTHGDVRFLQANALEEDIPGQYDLVFANQLIEHLVYPGGISDTAAQ